MIRPPAAQSLKTFERVFKATGSIQEAADAVAAAAVVYSRGLFGGLGRERTGALSSVNREALPGIVIEVVCAARGVPVALLISGSRQRFVTRARHEIMWILSEEAGFTMREVGVSLNLADHSSVPYGVEAMRERLVHIEGLAAQIKAFVGNVRDAAVPSEERRAA